MGSFSIWHWLIVLLVVLLIFGPKKLSEVGKGLGEGMKNFKKGLNDDDDASASAKETKESAPPAIEATSKSSKDASESNKTKDNDRAAG
ncbi:MAG TPA: Sec-independent protein translocase subunit TatA [Polyangiaceae bacterium]